MDALNRARSLVRRDFETFYKELDGLLKQTTLKDDEINVKMKLFNDTCDALQLHDAKIIDHLHAENASEAVENKEWDEIGDFKIRAETIRQLKEKKLPNRPPPTTESITGSYNAEMKIRNFKLPTIQLKKFNGELEDWLGFWAQFEKIDKDPLMLGSDKLWYLLHSMQPGTDAYELVSGYPTSNENYPIVIEALRKRYGDNDLQLQVYLRQLLKLVISNVDSKDKLPVKKLYMKLDSHLRALKTLQLEKADPATWLFPLVESCLHENILDNWQRSPLSSHDGSKDNPTQTRLDLLMSFVGREVDIQQRIEITRSFVQDDKKDSTHVKISRGNDGRREKRHERGPGIPTLSSFHASEIKGCVFCDRPNHESGDCFRASSRREWNE